MAATTWDRAYPDSVSPVWLWHVLPGFIGETVTIFRATEATHLESHRRFGFPADHPCRLENHAGVLPGAAPGATDWTVVPVGVSARGVARYRLREAVGGRWLSADPRNDRAALAPADTLDVAATTWFLVPRTGAAGRGWDIVHAAGGKRLVATPDGRGVALTAWIHPVDHWDVACVHGERARHRSHWWAPLPFFRDAFRDRFPEEPFAGGFAPVAGTAAAVGGAVVRAALPPAEARRRADADRDVGFLALDTAGAAAFYHATGNVLDVGREADGAPAAEEERERRAYQDRSDGGRPCATFYARRPPPADSDATAVYRECLVRIGMDAPLCERMLSERFPAEAERHAAQRAALGTAPGATRAGLCGGARLASSLCQRVCADARSAQAKICEAPLRAWCLRQTVPGAHDPMCACWLPDEVYRAAQAQALRRSGVGTDSPLHAVLSKAVQSTGQPVCTYGPCLTASIRPDFKCPNTSTMICLQEMSNNTLSSGGGDIQLTQSCNFAGGETAAEPTAAGPPAVDAAVDAVRRWVEARSDADVATAVAVCVGLGLLAVLY